MMAFRKLVLAGGALLATACALPPVQTAEPNPRRGEEVSRICIGSNSTQWGKLDNNSIVLAVGKEGDAYELELDGVCMPRNSTYAINLASDPASNCIETTAAEAAGSCVVRKIYKWDRGYGGPALSTAYNSPRSY